MTTILLLIIYICYIGLGIPDSLLGTAWPAIYQEFTLPIASINVLSILISGGTIISSLLSARLVNRFGTGKITAVSTALTALALFGFSTSNNLIWLCLSAIPLGLGAGSIDSALNNYVALHYNATHMNFLHCFYGVGVSLSPYLMSLALSQSNDWRNGYHIVFYVQFGIALLTLLALPLWHRVKATSTTEEASPKTLSLVALSKMPAVRSTWGVFIGSSAIESICLIWGSTYLVTAKEVTPAVAAQIIMFYYIGMALGRFLSGVLAVKLSSWQLIKLGQCITFVAIVLLLLPLSTLAVGIGLFLVGLGNGSIFPNMTHLTPLSFGRDISQSVIGTQMAASFTSIMLAPVCFGFFAQFVSIRLFTPYLLVMFLLMAYHTLLLKRRLAH